MPSQAPLIGDLLTSRLRALGGQLRARRVQLKVSATVVAEAAGMSRITLHRIERGEPSVTMGAYLGAFDAVGLQLELIEPQARKESAAGARLPAVNVRLDAYPELKRLAWQLHGVTEVSPEQALSLYERNWRHVDLARLEPAERELVLTLTEQFAGGRLLV